MKAVIEMNGETVETNGRQVFHSMASTTQVLNTGLVSGIPLRVRGSMTIESSTIAATEKRGIKMTASVMEGVEAATENLANGPNAIEAWESQTMFTYGVLVLAQEMTTVKLLAPE